MILTHDEYKRGFLDFDADLPEGSSILIWTATADSPQDEPEWEGPYSNPLGSKVLSPERQYVKLRMEPKCGGTVNKSPVLKKVRWERDGKTFIWPGPQGFSGPPGSLVLGRDYGYSYRLVISPNKAIWSEPLVLIDKNVRVRLSKGKLTGYKIEGFDDAVPDANGKLSIEGAVEESEAEGDLLEVMASVSAKNESEGKELSKNLCHSIVGLIALSMGQQILGNQLFEDYFYSAPNREEGYVHIPLRFMEPTSINAGMAGEADNALTTLTSIALASAMNLALRWYFKALTSTAPTDSFISHFIGIETIITSWFAQLTPPPTRKEYQQLRLYLSRATPRIDNGLRDVVLERIADFPLVTKFEEYWKVRFGSKSRTDIKHFRSLKRLRDSVSHGKVTFVEQNVVSEAQELLERILARELSIGDATLRTHTEPRLFSATLKILTVPK